MPKFNLLLTAAALSIAATSAPSQELAPPDKPSAAQLYAAATSAQGDGSASQEIEATYTWSATDVVPTMPMGESQDVFLVETSLVNTSADGPLAGLAGRCLLSGVNDLATFGYTESGTCVWQDANGDQLWERFQGQTEGNGAPAVGRASWIGGTGRFEGASGQTEYSNTFSASSRTGLYQGTGTKRGTINLPES